MDDISVQISKLHLLRLASGGDMKGQVPSSVSLWASRICVEHGLADELRKMQDAKISDLVVNIKNTLGEDGTEKLRETLRSLLHEGMV